MSYTGEHRPGKKVEVGRIMIQERTRDIAGTLSLREINSSAEVEM